MRKEDARIGKTNEKLFESFKELLREKKFEDITVNDICDHSGVRRGTFYKHFKDKWDFLRAMTNDLRRIFEERFRNKNDTGDAINYYLEYATELVRFIERHRDMIGNLLCSSVKDALINFIVAENIRCTHERLLADERAGRVTLCAPAETVSVFLSTGVAHSVIANFNKDNAESLEVFTEHILSIVKAVFRK